MINSFRIDRSNHILNVDKELVLTFATTFGRVLNDISNSAIRACRGITQMDGIFWTNEDIERIRQDKWDIESNYNYLLEYPYPLMREIENDLNDIGDVREKEKFILQLVTPFQLYSASCDENYVRKWEEVSKEIRDLELEGLISRRVHSILTHGHYPTNSDVTTENCLELRCLYEKYFKQLNSTLLRYSYTYKYNITLERILDMCGMAMPIVVKDVDFDDDWSRWFESTLLEYGLSLPSRYRSYFINSYFGMTYELIRHYEKDVAKCPPYHSVSDSEKITSEEYNAELKKLFHGNLSLIEKLKGLSDDDIKFNIQTWAKSGLIENPNNNQKTAFAKCLKEAGLIKCSERTFRNKL